APGPGAAGEDGHGHCGGDQRGRLRRTAPLDEPPRAPPGAPPWRVVECEAGPRDHVIGELGRTEIEPGVDGSIDPEVSGRSIGHARLPTDSTARSSAAIAARSVSVT